MTILSLEGVTKTFTKTALPVVNQISLQLQQGNILALLGPSGCGKTTLLRLIAGFEQPNLGEIVLNDFVVSSASVDIPPEKRGVGMVFQDYALFPHLTVEQNLGFGLQQGGKLTRSGKQRVKEVLNLVGLEGLGDRYPYQLSGGQQQRVALARALAPRPALVLLDEPLSNLDVQVRIRLRQELRKILKAAGTSAIFVTHDQEEAMSIADEVAVMNQGVLEQLGTPEQVYLDPASRFVAEFVTQANFLPAHRRETGWETALGVIEIEQAVGDYTRAVLMIRQEAIHLQPDETGMGVICDRQFLGREQRYIVQLTSGEELIARSNPANPLAVGTRVNLLLHPDTLRLYSLR
ncbi:ABC transporter ATP-binding protein [Spirulina sp. CS-785/01]|uniref:ABC transporter ATP-binding protein n=1 Tax=Spirulina sp. CS-785/01 TaxID=3021716 RepID=UPI003FA6AED3